MVRFPEMSSSDSNRENSRIFVSNKSSIVAFASAGWGGAEKAGVSFARYLNEQEHQVTLLLPPSLRANCEVRELTSKGTVEAVDFDVSLADEKRTPIRFLRDVARSLRLLHRTKPETVSVYLPVPTRGLGLVVACALLKVPAMLVFQLVPHSLLLGRWYRRLMVWAMSRGQRWVAVSPSNRDRLSAYFGVDRSQIEVVHNGMDLCPDTTGGETPDVRARLGVASEARLVVTVGRLASQKGYDLIVPAIPHLVAEFPSLRFVWIGDGELRGSLEAEVARMGVSDYVVFAGWREEVRALLREAEVFLFPSRYEGFALSLLEAIQEGCPVVTSMTDGADILIEPMRTGLLFRREDSCDLMESLRWALRNPETMQGMSRDAREVAKRFSLKETHGNLARIMSSLLAAGNPTLTDEE